MVTGRGETKDLTGGEGRVRYTKTILVVKVKEKVGDGFLTRVLGQTG